MSKVALITGITGQDGSYLAEFLLEKPFVDKFEQQIMFAEKSWGSFKVVDVETTSLTIKVTLNPGHSMNYHSHKNRDEVWVVISGEGKTIVDGIPKTHPVKFFGCIGIQINSIINVIRFINIGSKQRKLC